MSDERDELAGIIRREYTRAIDRRRPQDAYTAPADAIVAAGYRKPAVVTTAEELDALPVGSVVLTNDGAVGKIAGAVHGKAIIYATLGDNLAALNGLVVRGMLPATVLHVGGTE